MASTRRLLCLSERPGQLSRNACGGGGGGAVVVVD